MAGRLTPRRGAAAVGVVLAVIAVHGLLTERLADSRLAWTGAAPAPRLEAAFVRTLAPSAPPKAAPMPRAARPKRAAAVEPPVPAASAPDPTPPPEPDVARADTEPAAPPEPAASDAELVPSLAASAPEPAASAMAASTFEWPPSTRLSYRLTGWYRGEIHGSARVQWVRLGPRYQVHLDVDVALFVARRMTSDGELTDEGLRPRRYDEETRVLGQPRPRVTLHFEPGRIVSADGRERASSAGIQDTASQFVQLTWLFTTRPQLLIPGGTVEMPLALPRSSKRIVFDVLGEQRLDTPAGTLDTFHLKPRPDPKPGSDISAEVWFAPSLQYLPVRIRLQQGEITADLLIEDLPLQAEPDASR